MWSNIDFFIIRFNGRSLCCGRSAKISHDFTSWTARLRKFTNQGKRASIEESKGDFSPPFFFFGYF